MPENNRMDRRNVLRFGSLGLAGLGTGGCVLANANLADFSDEADIDLYVQQMQTQLRRIEKADFATRFAEHMHERPATPDQRTELEKTDAKVQRILQTLLLSQTFRELPRQTQRAPKIQALMKTHANGISDTVHEVTQDLEALRPAQRHRIRDVLRKRPNLPTAIGETLDRHARSTGLSFQNRLKLRTAMLETSHRLKNDDPSVLIDEYTAKVRRAQEPGRAEAFAIASADSHSRELLQRGQKRSNDPTGTTGLKVGGYIVGLAFATAATGAILEIAGVQGALLVLGATVGGVLLAIGLVTLIISGIVYMATS